MPNLLAGRVIRLRQILVVLSLALALLVSPALAQSPARLVAVGDVHGDYDALVAILKQAGLIDSKLNWTGRDATLVQTGDILDRGAKCRQVMDLLMKLEVEAPLRGGRVITLMGNHEAMNFIGDLRYAEAMYPSFVDKSSEKRRRAAYDAFVNWQKTRAFAGRLPRMEGAPGPEAEAAWMAAHPPGYIEQREAMSPTGEYGHWLRGLPAVAKVGTTLFVHGGIGPDLAGWKPEAIVERVRSEVKLFDDLKQRFVQQKILLPDFNLVEATTAARAELEFRNAELARKTADAAKNSKDSKAPPTFEAEQKFIQYLSMFLGYNSWFIVHPSGPLWFRGYATWSDEEGAANIDKLLEGLGVSQIVVGHTPQQDGRITSRFDGKVYLIDTGMLSSYYSGGRASALEIAAGKYTAIYPDERIVLRDSARAVAPSVPASHEDQISSEVPGGGLEQQEQSAPAKTPPPAAAEAAAPPARVWYDPQGNPLPFKSDEEVLDFLRTAKPGKMSGTSKGITHPRQVIMEKDGLQMRAFWRVFSEEKQVAQLASGERELNFRDDFIFEPAAYELSRMLGMDNVPPTILRSIFGEKGSLQVGVENTMDEGKRQKEKIAPPNARRWNNQMQIMRFFDNLVFNIDRNVGNILIDKDWKVWLIDHSRAFRQRDNLNNPDALVEIDKGIWEKLLALDDKTVKEHMKPYLRGFEIDALNKRRKKIIEIYRAEIAKRGESEVVRDLK